MVQLLCLSLQVIVVERGPVFGRSVFLTTESSAICCLLGTNTAHHNFPIAQKKLRPESRHFHAMPLAGSRNPGLQPRH
jgi:hypothetical protein